MDTNQQHFNGYEWYRRKMEQRTRAVLKKQDETFERLHGEDSDEELLRHVHAVAKALGHAPQMCEVPGAQSVASRFGSWRAVLRRLGYAYPAGSPELVRSRRYREEYARQQELYRAERQKKIEARMMRKKNKQEPGEADDANGQ